MLGRQFEQVYLNGGYKRMTKKSLGDTIYEIMDKHVNQNNGIFLGECVCGPGSEKYAIPISKNVIDIPMSETAGADFAVGCAIAGRRPVFLVKYQDFMLLGASPFITYASVVKELQGISAPVFIRAISADHYDCNHSNVLHSMFMHYPGMYVCAPMTSKEYENAWNVFMSDDKPFYCSEYKDAFSVTYEMEDEINDDAEINIFCISKARLNIFEAKKILLNAEIKINVFHIAWLKPLEISKYIPYLIKCPLGLVVDAGRVICGTPEHIAYELMNAVEGSKVYAFGIEDVPKSTNPKYYNEVPSGIKIAQRVIEILSTSNGKRRNKN